MAVATARTDLSARELRSGLAQDAKAARRMLAIGLVLEGGWTARPPPRTAGHRCHERPPRRDLRAVAEGARAVLVLDGARWHGAKALKVPDNITLLPLPPYAPELNPVENVWAYLRANRLAISVFKTYEDVVARCCDAWNFFANVIATMRSITTREYAKAVEG